MSISLLSKPLPMLLILRRPLHVVDEQVAYRALHSQTWKLAELGRDRDQSLQPPMPWKTPDRGHRHTTPPDQGLKSPHQSRPRHYPAEVHQETGTGEDELRFCAVIVLVLRWRLFDVI